ncbi:MAG: DUF421 domain-containing protein [Ruminococcus sp.]|nr:DUF421 domain-containing protein [Ruminococcus sp.]
MTVVIIRAVMLYILVIFSVRLMGKRQLGELQPSELVVTILVSNIATLPVEDTDIPLIVGITPILTLVCFEVIVSWISLKCPRLRRLISGSPKIVISSGRLDTRVLRELRFSADDLMTALRGQDVFDISEVQFAIVETTGSISVMKKPSADVPQRCDLGITQPDSDPPQVIMAEGRTIRSAAEKAGASPERIAEMLRRRGIAPGDVFIMTGDGSGKYLAALRNGGDIITMEEKHDKSGN